MEALNYHRLLWVQTTISDHCHPPLRLLSSLQDREPRAALRTNSIHPDHRLQNPQSLLANDNLSLKRPATPKGRSLRGSFSEMQPFFATSGED